MWKKWTADLRRTVENGGESRTAGPTFPKPGLLVTTWPGPATLYLLPASAQDLPTDAFRERRQCATVKIAADANRAAEIVVAGDANTTMRSAPHSEMEWLWDVKLPIHVNKKSEMNSKEVATTWRQRRRLMTMRDKCTENMHKNITYRVSICLKS